MKLFNFYQVIIFTVELLAVTLLFFGGYVFLKTEEFNSFGAGCFIFGSLIVTSFVLEDYCNEFSSPKVINIVLIVDIVMVLCTLLTFFTTFGYTVFSEILINDLSNIRIITGKSKLLYWITLRIESGFGCCRTFDMVSY